MRVSTLAVAALTLSVDGFTSVPSFTTTRRAASLLKATKDLHQFDFILQEGDDHVVENALHTTRRRVVVPGSSADDSRAIQMTSAASFSPSYANEEEATEERDEPMLGDDEYDYTEQLNKIQQYEEESQRFNLNEYMKNADFGDLVVTLAIPSIIAFVGARFAYNKVYKYLDEKSDVTLDSFANEMIYHDGDFEEMKMCKDDYARKLAWMGPKRNDAMLKRYLQVYAKKKTVSPQSIRYVHSLHANFTSTSIIILYSRYVASRSFIYSSLSYAFTLFNLSEAQAAYLLVTLCREMGTDKISSAGKLLFFGSRILKSPEGKVGLVPIKDMIKSTYRDEEVADTLVETSQV